MPKSLVSFAIGICAMTNFAFADVPVNFQKVNAQLASALSSAGSSANYNIWVRYTNGKVEPAANLSYRVVAALSQSPVVRLLSGSTQLKPLGE